MSPKILVTGITGQVGGALLPVLKRMGSVTAIGRKQCDLADVNAVAAMIRAVRPQIIVNSAAYTAVDRAQNDRLEAFAINTTAPHMMAQTASEIGATLIHYSTDYVFDGRKATAYLEEDETNPLSVYGMSKREGENRVRQNLSRHFILRTSWIFSETGDNFLKTMLRLAAERDELAIVADQIGSPTSARLLAEATGRIVQSVLQGNEELYGTYHLTAGGKTSWYGYASYAIAEAKHIGLPVCVRPDRIKAVASKDFPAAVTRPANSCLDTAKFRKAFGMDLPPWQQEVSAIVKALAQ